MQQNQTPTIYILHMYIASNIEYVQGEFYMRKNKPGQNTYW